MRRQNLCSTALGQHAMTDFTTTGEKTHAGLADTERREVVVQHELFEFHRLDIVHTLLINLGSQGCCDQRLGFTAGEERAAV